jgi:predicted N-acetyltransferase YhbS
VDNAGREETTMDITVRELREDDLDAADRVMRVAFGTYIGVPEPATFMGDAAFVRPRRRAAPDAAFAAITGGELVGSNFATNWGSVGFFGPLTIRPDVWDSGIGKLLMEPVMNCFARWGSTHAGLFTFADSTEHAGLYRRFGFWPRFLTALMAKPVERAEPVPDATTFSAVPQGEREGALDSCRALTDMIFEGLDVRGEIVAVAGQALGDTVLLHDGLGLAAFAVCHTGKGTEGGSGACYVKFGAARPGPNVERNFHRLLEACEVFAAGRHAPRLTAGVNLARDGAARAMMERGFRTEMQGVTMHRPNDPGYSRPDAFVIDDWR